MFPCKSVAAKETEGSASASTMLSLLEESVDPSVVLADSEEFLPEPDVDADCVEEHAVMKIIDAMRSISRKIADAEVIFFFIQRLILSLILCS